MEFLLAMIAVATGLVLARRGVLHPGDYLVGASLAVMCAVAVFIATPSAVQAHVLSDLGAPQTAVLRSEFLANHGVKIVLSAIVLAIGACVEAIVRRRATPGQFA